MFKNLLFCVLAIQAFMLHSQCYPVFRDKTIQPPPQDSGYYLYPPENMLSQQMLYVKNHGGAQNSSFSIWNGTEWYSTKKTDFKYVNVRLVKWKDKILGYGYIKHFDGVQAPAKKYFGILEYKGDHWDTLPGCLLDSGVNFVVNTSRNNLYLNTINSGEPRKGRIYRYREDSAGFHKIADYEENYNPFLLIGGDKRMLLANVTKINGMAANGFAYIDDEDGIIRLNTDTIIDYTSVFGIDASNDHIHGLAWNTDITLYEFSDSLIGIRKSNLPVAQGYNNYLQVHKGTVVYMTRDNNNIINNYNLICHASPDWISIQKSNLYGAVWSYPITSRHGVYVVDFKTWTVKELKPGARLNGKAFFDRDSNCLVSQADIPLAFAQIEVKSNDYHVIGQSNAQGEYEVFVTPGNYEISSPGAGKPCSISKTDIRKSDTSIKRDLPIKGTSQYDLGISMMNNDRVRWNTTVTYNILIENTGMPCDSAYFEFVLDPKLRIAKTDGKSMVIHPNLVRGKLYNIPFRSKQTFQIYVHIDTASTKIDSLICNRVSVHNFKPEKDSSNNHDRLCQKVVYSYDPNLKTCHTDEIPDSVGSRLDYHIAFQNEGNDDAWDVVVTDTLPPGTDMETLRIKAASHPYLMQIRGNVIAFTFNNIYLKPKSEDEALSQGYIHFSINTRNTLNAGTKIRNRAFIYFDLNKPVITNTAVVSVVSPASSIIPIQGNNNTLSLYPNPADKIIRIRANTDAPVYIYNSCGQRIYMAYLHDTLQNIDVSAWPNGLYIVRCGSQFAKFVKQD